MRALCICGREHRWETGDTLCPCGTVLEGQTDEQVRELQEMHGKRIALLVENNPHLILRENQ